MRFQNAILLQRDMDISKGWKLGIVTATVGLMSVGGAYWFNVGEPAASSKKAVQGAAIAASKPSAVVPDVANENDWNALGPARRNVLLPLRSEWSKLDAQRRLKWIRIADRYPSMKPDAQARVRSRMRDWVKLTPEQRIAARENYLRNKKIQVGKKAERWQKYQNVAAIQRTHLSANANATG